jgi:uncharacterized protein (DUF1501 family)
MASSLDTFKAIHAMTPQSATDYRALVCVFLNGGNDGNNMFVDLGQYSSYASSRGVDLAIGQGNFLAVSPSAVVVLAFIQTCLRCSRYLIPES